MDERQPDPQAAMPPVLALALQASFGSLAQWQADREAALRRGVPAVLAFRPQAGMLRILDAAHADLASGAAVPLLTLEAGADAAHPPWDSVHARYRDAVDAASDALGATPDETAGARLVDVRRAEAFRQAATQIDGAEWRDPAAIADWAPLLAAAGGAVVVYCVHGHEVSRAAALRLRAAGAQARFLRGGIEAWQAAGRPLQARAG